MVAGGARRAALMRIKRGVDVESVDDVGKEAAWIFVGPERWEVMTLSI